MDDYDALPDWLRVELRPDGFRMVGEAGKLGLTLALNGTVTDPPEWSKRSCLATFFSKNGNEIEELLNDGYFGRVEIYYDHVNLNLSLPLDWLESLIWLSGLPDRKSVNEPMRLRCRTAQSGLPPRH